ncbi:MAG: energy-coupling factor transporter ATPase [Lachnospiraceae bacterium]|nr:energy-coupling factor transporter ATPase [Lachnospiraceae bacterium]
MKIIKSENLVHKFSVTDENDNIIEENSALDGVNIEVEEGQFIAILGHNGSGKSTFARHINAMLTPDEGTLFVNGWDTRDESKIWDIRQNAGMVFQNPDNQIIATVVEEDVGFGPENLGVPTEEIWERVEKALSSVGMLEYRHHSPTKLSGGQKQRVAIAGVVAMKPKCIVLDEPTAMLDPNGRKEVIKTVRELNKQENVTVILITHHMNEVIDADKVFVMDKGQVVMEGTPREVFAHVDEIKKLGLDVPQVTEIADRLNKNGIKMGDCVLTIKEFKERFKAVKGELWSYNAVTHDKEDGAKKSRAAKFQEEKKIEIDCIDKIDSVLDKMDNKLLLKAENLRYVYEEGTAYEKGALDGVSLDIHEGEFLAIIGHTGSGKSTLIQHLNGLIKADSGSIYFNGENIYDKEFSLPFLRKHVGLVFQYPEHQLFETTVFEDVCFGPKNLGLSKEEIENAARKALKQVGLDESYFEKSPFELSGGEKRRVAIAGVLAMNPDVLILDEPTAGLDPKGRDSILNKLKELQLERNIAIVLVSHSMEDVAKYADRLVVMNQGKKLFDGEVREVFGHYKELEEIGLAAPQVTYLMAETGKTVTTVDEAVEILLG